MADWALPILGSALTLGIYDVFKKHAVRGNSVMPVLFLATLSGSIFYLLLTGARAFLVSPVSIVSTPEVLLVVFLKSLLVSASWAFVYYGLRDLPVSIASPLRSTAPLWSICGAMLIFHEMPLPLQWLGMAFILAGCLLFTLIGSKENFSWHSRGMLCTMTGTLLGSASALYDKFLLGVKGFDPVTVQFHFSWMLVVILGTALLVRHLFTRQRPVFYWRWSIVVTGILLIVADALYFYALSLPDAQISILSLLRRTSVVVAFAVGGGIFREKLLLPKGAVLLLILAGAAILTLCK